MAIFVRPAVWSYDIEMFRSATADEDELEALLAAIATPGQSLWVVESDERPAAFAWTAAAPGRVRLLRLYVRPHDDALPLLRPLVERIREEARENDRLEIDSRAVAGVDEAVLAALGLT